MYIVYVTYLLRDRRYDIVSCDVCSCTINSRILSEVEHGNKIQIVSQLSKVSTFFLLLKPVDDVNIMTVSTIIKSDDIITS